MKRLLAFLMATMLVFATCGCGKDSKKNNESGKKTVDALELSIYSYKPDTLCPVLSRNEANIQMLGIVYEGLISLSDTLYPDPCLAESWSVSEDGIWWTLALRQDVLWHDGTVFDSDDVVYTVNSIKKNEGSIYSYNVSNIKSITAKGHAEIKIELFDPWANFVNLLYFPIIKSGTMELDAADFVPVGTGPYSFEDRNEGNVFCLVRNDEWWGEKPATKTIAVKMLPDNDTALYAFGSGSIDLTTTEDMSWGRFVDPVSASYTTMPTPVFHFLGINHKNETLALPEVRKAISYAVNREEIISEVMTGYATAATMPVHPKWFMCGEKEFVTKQNNNAARKELQENGWELADGIYRKTGEETGHTAVFKILYNEDNAQRESVAAIIKKNLEELGFGITVEKVTFEDYQTRISEGDYDMFVGSYIISPDADFSFVTNEDNVFGYADEAADKAIENIRKKYSISGIEEGYGAVIDRFEESVPIVGLFFEDKIMVYSNRIKGDVAPSYFDVYRGIETLRKEETK